MAATWVRATTVVCLALVCLTFAISCVRRPAIDAPSRDDSGPRLISCPESTPAVDKTRQRSSVELRFTVNTDGRVESGSVRLVPNLNASNVSESDVAAARAVALSCVYAPAVRGGRFVAASVSRWFTVDATETSVRRP
jgi:hypothetical protein